MQAGITSQLVADTLVMAVWRRGKPVELLHRSDQGSPYTSEHFQKLLAEHGITCSMSRVREVWDHSAMESFFSSLKTERTARKVYRSREQARSDVFDYIECFYNPRRRHSTIGFPAPFHDRHAVCQTRAPIDAAGHTPPDQGASRLGRAEHVYCHCIVD